MSRRRFLKALPAAAVVPVLAADEKPARTKGELAVAQELLALDPGEPERERALDLVKRYRDHYEALRAITVPSDTEPAFSFPPPRPKPTPMASRRRIPPASAAPRVPRPTPTWLSCPLPLSPACCERGAFRRSS